MKLEFILTRENAIVRDGIDITIPAIVGEAQRVGEDRLVRIFLNHQEDPVAIVGNNQPRMLDEVRRPDPGGIFYHGNGATRCAMIAYPDPRKNGSRISYDSSFVPELQEALGEPYADAQIVRGDLDLNGKRLLSLSHTYLSTSWMVRSCWFERAPDEQVLKRIVDSGGSSKQHLERIQPLQGLYENLITRHRPMLVTPEDFVTQKSIDKALSLQYQPPRTQERYSCVTGRQEL